jgi:hypothetical protein
MTKGRGALPEREVAEQKLLAEGSWAFGPPKVMKNGSYSATTLSGSTALPFVISTEAQRSGEICGSAVLSWECFSIEFRRAMRCEF